MNDKITNKIAVFYTDHFVNRAITQVFAKSNNFIFDSIKNYHNYQNIIFCSYGIKRGSKEIFLNSKNFLYIDHGFISSSLRKFNENRNTQFLKFDGYFRFIRNDYYFNDFKLNINPERFEKLNLTLKNIKPSGEHIILSEPSNDTKNFLDIHNWTEKTIETVKIYSDRKIIVHNKFSKIPLDELLKNAYAFVSCQSTAAFKAISEGVPAYFTHPTLKKFGDLENINNRFLNYELLYIAANNQWKIKEFFSDEFKIFLASILN